MPTVTIKINTGDLVPDDVTVRIALAEIDDILAQGDRPISHTDSRLRDVWTYHVAKA